MSDTRSRYRKNMLGVEVLNNGKTIDRFESVDLDTGVIDFTVFYSDGTHEKVSHSLVSDALIAIKSLQLSGEALSEKLIVKKIDGTTLFKVDTSANSVHANLPIATGNVYQLVYDSGSKQLSYLDLNSTNTTTGNQTISSSGNTTVAGGTSTTLGSTSTTTSLLGTTVQTGGSNTTQVNVFGQNVIITNPSDNSPASLIQVTANVVAQLSPVQIIQSAPIISSAVNILNVFRIR
jgi:hypothetical protein